VISYAYFIFLKNKASRLIKCKSVRSFHGYGQNIYLKRAARKLVYKFTFAEYSGYENISVIILILVLINGAFSYFSILMF
jgi:hypothetical protein